jgi:hypothetical protein
VRNDDRAELILKEDRTQDSGRLGTMLVDLKKREENSKCRVATCFRRLNDRSCSPAESLFEPGDARSGTSGGAVDG